MNLFLVQHGQAKSKDEDPERPLNDAGEKASEIVARWLTASAIKVDEIRHSGKKRAEQTARIFAAHLLSSPVINVSAGLNPNDDVQALAVELKGRSNSLMIVGHLPFLGRLTGLLVCGDADRDVVRFQNSGVLCLHEDEGQWSISWMVVPDLV